MYTHTHKHKVGFSCTVYPYVIGGEASPHLSKHRSEICVHPCDSSLHALSMSGHHLIGDSKPMPIAHTIRDSRGVHCVDDEVVRARNAIYGVHWPRPATREPPLPSPHQQPQCSAASQTQAPAATIVECPDGRRGRRCFLWLAKSFYICSVCFGVFFARVRAVSHEIFNRVSRSPPLITNLSSYLNDACVMI